MGEYREPDWYNKTEWMNKVRYSPPWPRKHWWVKRFSVMRRHIPEGTSRILDLGCGNGIFPAFIHHKGYSGEYLGIDFSPGSIDQAIKGNFEKGYAEATFDLGSIYDAWDVCAEIGYEPDLMVCAETLEHLEDEDDQSIIDDIPIGMPTMVTVPRFDAPGHVRYFPKRQDVLDRYGDFFDDMKWEMIKAPWRPAAKWCHLFTGVKK